MDDIIDRMTRRLRVAREDFLTNILGHNQRIKVTLDNTLPQLRRELKSKPDLLRLIKEVYSYIEAEGEILSQAVSNLERVEEDSNMTIELLRRGTIDFASIETYLNAIRVYVQAEVPTIKKILVMFDRGPLQQALEELNEDQWQAHLAVIEAARHGRSH